MSVINKVLRDLDKRGQAEGKVEPSLRGADIPLPMGDGRQWKLAALALAIPLAVALGWILWQPSPETSSAPAKPAPVPPLAQVTPVPAEAPKKPAEPAPAPVPKQATVAPTPEPPAPAAAAPKPKPEPTTPPPAPAVVAAPPVTVAPPAPKPKPEPVTPPPAPSVAAAPPATVAPPAPRPKPEPTTPPPAPAVVAAPPVVAVAPAPAPAPAPATVAPAKPPLVADASIAAAKPAPKAEIPPSERPPDRKRDQPAQAAISITKKPPPPPQPVQQAEKAPPKTPAPTAPAAPSVAAATTGSAAAPEAAKGSIAVNRQGQGSSRSERVSAEYRNALDLMNQGRVDPAIDAFSEVLRADARHAQARQSLAALLISRGRSAEAQGVLREGLAVLPENTGWSMLLARLQVDGGDAAGALATLDTALPHARNRPDYHAFVGTLLQMQGRHREAIAHYEIAVRLSPESGRSLTGLAISLEEERRIAEARDAYARALATNTLGPDLNAFVERKLSQLK